MRRPSPLLMRASTACGAFALASLAACAGGDASGGRAVASLDTLPSPAAAGSAEPSLSSDGSVVWLSWLEPGADSVPTLRLARLDGAAWSEPRTVTAGRDIVVNWADFPSIIVGADGAITAHWLARAEGGKYAYGVRVARSTDGGATWSAPVVPHRDASATEHGFVAMWNAPGDSVGLAWLDGRKGAMPDSAHEMMLAFATIAPDGGLGAERALDPRTCDCCQTAAAMTARGPIVAYRDRSADEIRDIHVTRLVDGSWTAPAPVHRDGWRIDACPVNGPQLSARGDTVAIAWFTAPGDSARVNVAFSTDGGATFAAPVRVDDGLPSGRVDVELGEGGRAIVSWIERIGASPASAVPAPREGGGGAEVRLRTVRIDGSRSDALTVASSTGARASGFPRMARSGRDVVLAWTEPGTPARVRVARARLD